MPPFNPEVLKSGKTRERRERALAVLSAALEAVDPIKAIRRQVSLSVEEDFPRPTGVRFFAQKYSSRYRR